MSGASWWRSTWWRSRLAWLVMALTVAVALFIGARPGSGSQTPAQRVNQLASQVRCPGCTDLSAAESSAPSAVAVRQYIASQVKAGRSDQSIDAFLVSRYGPGILLQPPSNGIGAVLWLVPIGGGLILAAVLVVVTRRRRRQAAGGEPAPMAAPGVPTAPVVPALPELVGAAPLVPVAPALPVPTPMAKPGLAWARWLGRGRRRKVVGLAGLASLAVAGALVAGLESSGHSAASTPVAAGSAQQLAAQLLRARTLASGGQYAQSLKLLDQVLQGYPDQPQALAYRGWVLRLTGVAAHRPGLVQQGRASVAQAVEEDPSYPDARVFLGYMDLQDQHDPAAAVVQFRQFLADGPPPLMVDLTRSVVAQAFAAVGQPVPPSS